jgi:ribosomal protein S18 acetylase RimI-like enzyme
MTSPGIRSMQECDLPAVLQVQAECFDAVTRESQRSFLAKLAASPSTCFVAVQGSTVAGYLIAVPADSRSPPVLNADCFEIPSDPDCLYLHDLSVSPRARGSGVAEALVEAFLSRLKQLGFTQARLTAVNDSADYWARHGFEIAAPSGPAMDRIATYGEGARYMVRRATD